MKELDGFTGVPELELSPDELKREITASRIAGFEGEVGESILEDFLDVNAHVFGGYLMAKYPEHAPFILEELNSKYSSANTCTELFMENERWEEFWQVLADFINLTVHTKAKANVLLASVAAYYEYDDN